MRVKYTTSHEDKINLATLALAITLIEVKMARDSNMKAGNMLRNLKGSCKSKWVLK